MGVTLLFFFLNVALAYELDSSTPETSYTHPIYTPTSSEMDRHALLLMVAEYANLYGVSYQEMVNTIQCESGFVTDIQSRHLRPDGSREQSYGLVQIYLPAWPNTTYEQAINPKYSIEFMAKKFSAGDKYLWTCWNQLYGS